MKLYHLGLPATFCVLAGCGLGGLQARDYGVSYRLLNGKAGEPIPKALAALSLIYDSPRPRG